MDNLPSLTNFRVRAKRHPFDQDPIEARAICGQTIRDIVGDSDSLSVALDGRTIPASEWGTLKPLAGQVLSVVPLPRNDKAKQLLGVAAVVVAAVYAGPLGAKIAGNFAAGSALGSSAVWQGAIMAGTALAMSAIIKPPYIKDAE